MKRLFTIACLVGVAVAPSQFAFGQAPIVNSPANQLPPAPPAPNNNVAPASNASQDAPANFPQDETTNDVLPDLGAIDEQFSQATKETGNVWNRFIENSKQTLAQPFKPAVGNSTQPPVTPIHNGNLVQKFNDGTKRFVENAKQALTPKFETPVITPPKFKPLKLATPVFSTKPSNGNRLKNIFSPATAKNTKPRRSILASWLPQRNNAPEQPPTLGSWLSQDRPQ